MLLVITEKKTTERRFVIPWGERAAEQEDDEIESFFKKNL